MIRIEYTPEVAEAFARAHRLLLAPATRRPWVVNAVLNQSVTEMRRSANFIDVTAFGDTQRTFLAVNTLPVDNSEAEQ